MSIKLSHFTHPVAGLACATLLGALTPMASAQDLSVYRNDEAAEQIAVEKENRDAPAKALQATTVELIALTLDAKQSHWNLQGPEFYQLHLMYDEIAEDLRGLADRVAERKRQLGEPADGRPETIAKTANLDGFPEGKLADYETLAELSKRFVTVGKRLRQRIKDVEQSDAVTSNILQDTGERIDYWTWFLRSHQTQPTPK